MRHYCGGDQTGGNAEEANQKSSHLPYAWAQRWCDWTFQNAVPAGVANSSAIGHWLLADTAKLGHVG